MLPSFKCGAGTSGTHQPHERSQSNVDFIDLLVVLFAGSVPAWPYSRGWGYYPSGGLGTILLILIILIVLGIVPIR